MIYCGFKIFLGGLVIDTNWIEGSPTPSICVGE